MGFARHSCVDQPGASVFDVKDPQSARRRGPQGALFVHQEAQRTGVFVKVRPLTMIKASLPLAIDATLVRFVRAASRGPSDGPQIYPETRRCLP